MTAFNDLLSAVAAFLPGFYLGLRFAHGELKQMRYELTLQIESVRKELQTAREHTDAMIDGMSKRVDHLLEVVQCR
ncbi:MAG: hypothetical protein ACYCUI_11495 [Vulcanimicrobiaceae bacterium]